MELPLVVALEAHPRGATLYLAGTLTAAGVARISAACDALPETVRTLRVCARALAPSDPHAVAALAAELRGWGRGRGRRHAATRPHPALCRDAFVSEPCAQRDAAGTL
jgi:hypothetical protein